MNDPLALALDLQNYGLASIPIIPGTKRPAVKIRPFFESGPSLVQLPLLFHDQVEVAVLCGQPSDRLAIIDCDNSASSARMLSALGHPDTWLVKTLRGLHIYTRTPVPVKSTRGDGFDLQGQSKYCLAPGSMHPQQVLYEFIRKSQNILELPSLDAIPGLVLTPARVRPTEIPRRSWHLLTDEHVWKSDYASRSEAEYAIVLSLINSGCTYERAITLFAQHAHRDTHFQNLIREHGAASAEDWLRRIYDSASEFASAHSNPERILAQQARQWVLKRAWPGHAGAYDRTILLQHIAIAEQAGHLVYQASVRDLAEMAGVSIKTVSHANRRLVKAQLIGVSKRAFGTLAAMWKLNVFAVTKGNTPQEPKCRGVLPFDNDGHDAFRWAGLGKSGAQVWNALRGSPESQTAADLAASTGRAVKTVYRALERMFALGMVDCAGSTSGVRWSAVPNIDLAAIARELGTHGSGKRQRELHRDQRDVHAQVVARAAERRARAGQA